MRNHPPLFCFDRVTSAELTHHSTHHRTHHRFYISGSLMPITYTAMTVIKPVIKR